jgi:ankyrin repeat protein
VHPLLPEGRIRDLVTGMAVPVQKHRFMRRDIDEELVWALHCESPTLDKVRELVAKGADVNACDDLDLPCDCEACQEEDGAYVTARTVLMHAVSDRRVSPEVIRYLVEQGANAKAVVEDGDSALSFALWNMKLTAATVELLIQHGADVHQVNSSGDTPLLALVGHFRLTPCVLDVVRVLVAAGADVNATDEMGESVLERALRNLPAVPLPVIDYLIASGATVDFTDPELLLTAVVMFNPSMVTFLLKKGANPNALLEDDTTVLDYVEDWARDSAKNDPVLSKDDKFERDWADRMSATYKVLMQAGAKHGRDSIEP